jgi:hypothetical protein
MTITTNVKAVINICSVNVQQLKKNLNEPDDECFQFKHVVLHRQTIKYSVIVSKK